MGNHYHLLVQTPNANLARGMRELNGVYAQAFNRRHGRDGHLFQGRYQAILVQADAHLLSAVRYIVRNPVRAGICARVEEWRWSSHAATVGSRPPGFLAVDRLLSFLHDERARARALYAHLVDATEEPPGPSHPLVHGDEDFVASQLTTLEPSPEHPRAYIDLPRPHLSDLVRSTSDARAIVEAHRTHGYSMRQIATHLGCGVTTIHRRIRSVENGLLTDQRGACGT